MKIENFKLKIIGNGFSFIELIVVVAMMVILSTIVMVNFRELRSQQLLQSQASDIISKIREVQTNVQNGKALTGTSIYPRAYQIVFGAGSASYGIDYMTETATTTLTTVNLSESLRINQIYVDGAATSPVAVFLEAPYAAISINGLSDRKVKLDIQNINTGRTRSILIDGISGRIGLE